MHAFVKGWGSCMFLLRGGLMHAFVKGWGSCMLLLRGGAHACFRRIRYDNVRMSSSLMKV